MARIPEVAMGLFQEYPLLLHSASTFPCPLPAPILAQWQLPNGTSVNDLGPRVPWRPSPSWVARELGRQRAGFLGRVETFRDLHFPGRNHDVGIRTDHASGLGLGDVAERLFTGFIHVRIAQCLMPIALKAKGSTTQPQDENTETNREPTLHPLSARSLYGR